MKFFLFSLPQQISKWVWAPPSALALFTGAIPGQDHNLPELPQPPVRFLHSMTPFLQAPDTYFQLLPNDNIILLMQTRNLHLLLYVLFQWLAVIPKIRATFSSNMRFYNIWFSFSLTIPTPTLQSQGGLLSTAQCVHYFVSNGLPICQIESYLYCKTKLK